MRYIEAAQKITLTKEASEDDIRQALLDRLHRAFDITSVTNQDHGFQIIAKTGSITSFIKHAQVKLDIHVTKDNDIARVLISGYAKTAKSLFLSYSVLFFMVLLTGLLPGSIETNGESSSAIDALVFVIFGIFIFYDINKKMVEPQERLRDVLGSLRVEFG